MKFGTAGNPESFKEEGYKSSLDMPEWLKNRGLDAYEYQCGKGVRISENLAEKMKECAALRGILLSVHAPYYINMSSVDPEKRNNSVGYITASMKAAHLMGAGKVVVHPGSCTGLDRKWCLETAISVLKTAGDIAADEGYGDVIICPELMGKENQLGTLNEVIELSNIDERYVPTIDFGHLNARELGSLKHISDYKKVFGILENGLGRERARNIHVHFSKIEYTGKGEKKHRKFSEGGFEPDCKVFIEAAADYNLRSVVICESPGTQAEDALTMKRYYIQREGL